MNVRFRKSIATIFVVFTLFTSFTPVFARKAEAFIIVDWVNFAVNAITSFAQNSIFVKEYALDALAWQVMNMVIEKMAKSTVIWINSGFKGSPAFITDPGRYYKNLGDKIAGQLIFQNPKLRFLCGPIQSRIQIALSFKYTRRDETRFQCSLTKIGKNFDNFMNDFDNGGWENFFEISQKPLNNPVGAFIHFENDLYEEIAKANKAKDEELRWGQGFLSFKKCEDWSRPENAPPATSAEEWDPEIGAFREGTEQAAIDAEAEIADNPTVTDAFVPKCIRETTSTPGSVIQTQLNKSLGLGNERLTISDEINEIFSALLNQLTNRVIGGIGAGLRSLSSPDSGNNGRSFIDQFSSTSTDAKIDEYFKTTSEKTNQILNQPDYNPYMCRDNPTHPDCLPPPGDPNNSDSGTVNARPIMPNDKDCSLVDYSILDAQARSMANASGGTITYNQAMQSLDCDPPGIH